MFHLSPRPNLLLFRQFRLQLSYQHAPPGPPSALGFRPILLRVGDMRSHTPPYTWSASEARQRQHQGLRAQSRHPVPSRHHPTWRRGVRNFFGSIQTEVRWKELIAQYQEECVELFEVQDDSAANKERRKALLDEAIEAIGVLKAFYQNILTRWATRRAVAWAMSCFPLASILGRRSFFFFFEYR